MTTVHKVLNFVLRYGALSSGIALVLLTVVSKELTGRVMLEVLGFGMVAIVTANIALVTFTHRSFVDTDAQGAYAVQASTILGAFIFVGLAVIGIYYMRSDGANAIPGAVRQQIDSTTISRDTFPGWHDGGNRQQ